MIRIHALLAACGLVGLLVTGCGGTEKTQLTDQQRSRSTVLVRTDYCQGVKTGSGFFINEDELVTNRHVVEGAHSIMITMPDGQDVPVSQIEVSPTLDLAVLHVALGTGDPLDLGDDPQSGDFTWVVGYPRSGSVRVTEGRVVDIVPGDSYEETSPVIRTRAEADPGNSGGPLQDRQGSVAGLVFAVEFEDGWTLAFPVTQVKAALATVVTRSLRVSC